MLAEPRAVHRLGLGHRQAEDRLEASGRLARRFAEQISKFENVGIDDMTKNYLQHDTDIFLRFTIFSPRCILTNFLSLFFSSKWLKYSISVTSLSVHHFPQILA